MRSMVWIAILFLLPLNGGSEPLEFEARSQVKQNGDVSTVQTPTTWAPEKTVAIVCDMWNEHWCVTATERVDEMVPRMNDLLRHLREQGVLIIHAPSETVSYYEQTLPRKRARQASHAEAPSPIQGWCHLNPEQEFPLPIDDSDGGCDTIPPCEQRMAWTMQHPGLEIAPQDAISADGQEIYNLIAQRQGTNVIVLGVHTNMCVLGRPFGIRQMTYHGLNVVLVRDLTDTMYNPRMHPYVSHDEGTALVVKHIETYWCPSVMSADLMD